MGSVFAGKMIPEAILHSLKKRGRTSPIQLETECLYDEF